MLSGLSAKKVGLSVGALILAGVVGYSLGGGILIKSSNTKTSPSTTTVKTSTQTSSSAADNSSTASASDYKYSYLKNQCIDALQAYGTSIRAKAEAMAAKIRTEAANSSAARQAYQPQIDELLAYIKTMQTNMKTLQACISQVDQKHDFSATELSNINAAMTASKQ